MATLYCRLGTGVESYVVHASYSTATDPYPNGATITTSRTLSYVKDNSTVTIRASETECESGYTFPVYVYTSSDGSNWTQVDYLQSGTVTFNVGTGTKYVRVGPATKGSFGYDTNALYFRAGDGVKSFKMRYDSATDTGVISGSIGSTTVGLFVRDGTNASLSTVVYEDGYKSPFQFVEYTNSNYSTVKKYFTENDGDVYSNGRRYVKLNATYSPTYWYQMHADANGGTFSGGSTLWSSAVLSTTGNGGAVNYAVSNFPTPSRAGYIFKGWGASKTSTTTYSTYVSFVTSSLSSDDPKSVTVFAVWEKISYTAYVKLGDGVTSANVLVNGAQKAYITDRTYHAISIQNGDTLTISGIGKQTGYDLPYLLTYYASATATTPIRTAEYNTTSIQFTWAAGNLWMVVSATKSAIDLFYWQNATWDAANIKKGQPISNLTAARWNRFKAKIQELAEAEGGAYSYASVVSGGTIYATEFNGVRTAISNRTGHGTLPAAQAKGNEVKAALFEGTGSLKSALNAAITHYNNS